MSSTATMIDDDSSPSADELPRMKKRRLHGACDTCRKRKIKCDSAAMPGNICTNCQQSNIRCTHDIPRQPKKKDTQQAYIQNLEERLDKMERFLHTIHPERDIDSLIGDDVSESNASSPPAGQGSSKASSSKTYPDLRFAGPVGMPSGMKDQDPTSSEEVDNPAEEADDLAHIALAVHLSQLSMDAVEDRFFGQSSAFMLVKHATTVKYQMAGIPITNVPKLNGSKFRRPVYWDIRPWEREFSLGPEPAYIYPDEDLLQSLVSIYFEKPNTILPVLHEPTFRKALNAGRHLLDHSFGMTVLLVCAVASRYSHDPRIFLTNDTSGLSCGWKYFSQVPLHRNPLLYRSTIYDIQYYALAIVYLLGTSIPHAAWSILGLGVRYSLEKGAHRRKSKSQKPTHEDELLKRAFWSLIAIDQLMSSFLGRPCAVQDEDFDVEYPIECDDEYWDTEDPEQAFKQPPGKPCKITSFVCLLKQCEILAFALRTLYSTKKSKILTGLIGPEWEHRVVAELDSSLNKWKDSLPQFLRWNPAMKDPIFFHQSAFLHASFYYLQIQVHRPFITKKSPLTFPSYAMCTNAARSCCNVLEIAVTRGLIVFPNLFMAAFASGIVMLLNLWASPGTGITVDPVKEKENVMRCYGIIKECEKRWHIAGRLCDMLKELGSLDDYKPTMPKRRRDESSQAPSTSRTSVLSTSPLPLPPPVWPPIASESMGMPASTHTPLTAALPAFDTGATMPANDWDLSNLLMVQMGYMQQQLNTNPPMMTQVQQTPTQSPSMPQYLTDVTVMDSFDNRSAGMGYMPNFAELMRQQPEYIKTPLDCFDAPSKEARESAREAAMGDIPSTFSVDDWDAFLSGSMGQFF